MNTWFITIWMRCLLDSFRMHRRVCLFQIHLHACSSSTRKILLHNKFKMENLKVRFSSQRRRRSMMRKVYSAYQTLNYQTSPCRNMHLIINLCGQSRSLCSRIPSQVITIQVQVIYHILTRLTSCLKVSVWISSRSNSFLSQLIII